MIVRAADDFFNASRCRRAEVGMSNPASLLAASSRSQLTLLEALRFQGSHAYLG